MKTYHHNGEHWYVRDWSLFHHIRNWFIWIGGWEKANGSGWEIFRKYMGKWELVDPTPISIFGHRFTYYGWGWHLKIGNRWLTWSNGGGVLQVYLSNNGTPSQATTWLYGEPPDIRIEAHAMTPGFKDAHPSPATGGGE